MSDKRVVDLFRKRAGPYDGGFGDGHDLPQIWDPSDRAVELLSLAISKVYIDIPV